jgi:N-acetylglucosamine-6-sulfatase
LKSILRYSFAAFALGILSACAVPAASPQTQNAVPIPTSVPATAPVAGVTLPRPSETRTPETRSAPAAQSSTPASIVTNQSGGGQSTPGKKPNIILVLTDDVDAASMQFMPKLKSLISDQGVTFQNYFVAFSLCCPSRTTTLRGQYSHNTQIFGNSLPSGGLQKFVQLGEDKSTIATWLQDAGYQTMLAGKYLNDYPAKSNPAYIPPGWNEWYVSVKGNAYGEYNYTLNENGKEVAYGNKPEDYGTDVYVGKAVDFIQRSSKSSKPFFIYLAPYAAHAPYTPAPRHSNLFPGVQAPRTPNYNEPDVSDKPQYIREHSPLTPKDMENIDQDYRKRLQSLQAVDEGIENIVNTLKANGQLDNTYIFFTSDNGYHMGNHRMLVGKIAPYQEELRVTMTVRGPGVPSGQTRQQLVGNVDLAPTWADLAGAKIPDFVDGRSLVSLIGTNPPSLAQWRQVFGIENADDEYLASSITESSETVSELQEPPDQDEIQKAATPKEKRKAVSVPPLRGIKWQTMSYVVYSTGEKELYDLQADPYELNNLAPKASPLLIQVLDQRVEQIAACKGANCRTAEDIPLNLPK